MTARLFRSLFLLMCYAVCGSAATGALAADAVSGNAAAASVTPSTAAPATISATTPATTPTTTPAATHVDPGTLRIGSKRFTESYILAEVLAQTAAPALNAPPQVRQGLGNTAITYEALRSGGIDMYVEYTGTIAQEILKQPGLVQPGAMRRALLPLGLGMGIPLGFNDGYALAMRAGDADRLHIRSLSDLAEHPTLRFGLSNEFIGRADGWPGLVRSYRFVQQPTGLDHGLAYDAIGQRQVDVIDIYTTDAKIASLGLRVLDDDHHYFPRYDAVVLYRLDVPQRFPHAWAALQPLAGSIDERAMIDMNASAELKGAAFDAIARAYLQHAHAPPARTTEAAQPVLPASRGFLAKLFGADLGRLTVQHLALVLISVLAAIVIAVPVGMLAAPHPRARAVVLGIAGLLQTVPSLALLAILISLSGTIGTLPALVALTLYALLPIMRNTSTGLAEVPKGLRLAGAALGMTARQRRVYIELPLAAPAIVAGIRTATAISIGTATIAAFIGAGGYGERIVTGLALNDRQLLLAGAIPAALLAIVSELLFEGGGWLLRRRGPRGTDAASRPMQQ